VHKYVGGFLGPTNTAAADPVFYAHHANIDRLWCYWWNHYRGQPGFDCDRNWLCESLLFNDPDDGLVSIKVRDLLDESRLGYSYELPDKTLCFPFRVVLGTVGALGVVIYAKDAWVDLMSVVLEATHDPLRAWETALVQWVTFMELMEHRGQNASFPLAFVVPADRLRPTDGYYLLAVCPPCETGPTNRRVIGSFAVFASSHGKPAGSFANAVCLSGPDLVYVISTAVSKGGIGLVYGPPTADGCDIVADGARPLDVSSVEIRYPATPQDYRKLLGM